MPEETLPTITYQLTESQLNMEKREGRYKQYERSKKPVPFRLQEKDVELLRALEEYRFLDLDQIDVLLPRESSTTNPKYRRRPPTQTGNEF